MNNGKLSTQLLTIVLIVVAIMGLVASNTDLLQGILGNAYIKYGAFIGFVLLAFYNYYFPRLKKMVAGGEEVEIDNGKISTFHATAFMLFASVIIANPVAFNSIVGDQLGGTILSILTIVVAIYNNAYPRNVQSESVA